MGAGNGHSNWAGSRAHATLIVINLVMTVLSWQFLFKSVLIWYGGKNQHASERRLDTAVSLLRNEDLPIYTVLVPMFREPDVLPILANALLNWIIHKPARHQDRPRGGRPADHRCRDRAGLQDIFEIILVPPCNRRPNPRPAITRCNLRGASISIYDAEDKPEPDQLKKVVVTFDRAPDNVACVQCRLNYFNRDENWLTRLFTLDYRCGSISYPGSKSSRCRSRWAGRRTTSRWTCCGARWDRFNVTEDAIGIRPESTKSGLPLNHL